IRETYFANNVRFQMLINARSGRCREDCGYCSQSKVSKADSPSYPLQPDNVIIEGAARARQANASRYCIATSGRCPTDKDVDRLCGVVQRIHEQEPIPVCCSVGMVTEEQASRLRVAGVSWINHNLNASARYHPQICSTHSYQDRVDTIQNIKRAGLHACSGGIVGFGENDEDLVDIALAFRSLQVDAIPVNFYHPVTGTPLAGNENLTKSRCLKALALFRLLNPTKSIRLAAGRERHLGKDQPLALRVADCLFVNGYLTTPGDSAEDTLRMIESNGFKLEVVR
ncbi:MAG: biotin synthase BioB, partial [Pseudomonadota bacterium]